MIVKRLEAGVLMVRPKKIILVVVDTLRADHLGCYGYKRNTSPFIDEFSKECLFFKYAISPGSQTLPILASVFTSKYIMHHSILYNNEGKLDADKEITLAEVLQSLGYETAGFVGGAVLAGSTGIDKGFSLYDDEMAFTRKLQNVKAVRDGLETTGKALGWIEENKDKDFFTFIHYFDAHGPYINPPPYDDLFVDDPLYGEARMLDRVPDISPVGGIPNYQVLNTVLSMNGDEISYEHDLRYYVARYDGGIRYVDSLVCRLFEGLKKLGIYDEALIILMADHGEGMGENGLYFEHATTVTPEKVHVPLMFKPDKGRGMDTEVIDEPVSTIDIMPTILSLCGYDYSGFGLDGRPMAALCDPGVKRAEGRILLSETYTQYAMIYPGGKFVVKGNVKHDIGHWSADGRVNDAGVLNLVKKLDNAVFTLGPGDRSRMTGDMKSLERIIVLEQMLVKARNELSVLKKASEKEKESETAACDLKLKEMSLRVKGLEEALAERDRRIASLENSSTWRTLQWFDGNVIGPLMPPGSRRRASYGRMIASLREKE